MTAFLDTSVLICLINASEQYHTWSVQQFQIWKTSGPVIISDIVYCEFCAGMASQAHVDGVVSQLGLQRMRYSDAMLFRAGQAYKAYRSGGGQKTNVLPDFLIGAMAEVVGAPLITANAKDFVKYFPGVRLIKP